MYDYEKSVKEYKEKLEERNRQAAIEYNKKIMLEIEERKKRHLEEEKLKGVAINKIVTEKRSRGEIINEFRRKRLETQITTARWALALAMAMTLLFKDFWALWIIFICIYIYEVRRFKKEAWEADLKDYEGGNKK